MRRKGKGSSNGRGSSRFPFEAHVLLEERVGDKGGGVGTDGRQRAMAKSGATRRKEKEKSGYMPAAPDEAPSSSQSHSPV
mmetsp:Transcript_40545/g.114838  ORF Transcript_40545/g.114838 Transcript_40545/m.114838 type:complete len:80 (+) Transcript_40545:169-408(+)